MPRFAALDTAFLIALAGGDGEAEHSYDYLARAGFVPLITESVFEQLGEIRRLGHPNTARYAQFAAQQLSTWGILDPPNAYTANGTSEVHAQSLLEQNLIPGATLIEANMLVEAACHGCEILVTYNAALINAPSAQLNLALVEKGFSDVIIASPQIISTRPLVDIVKAIEQKK